VFDIATPQGEDWRSVRSLTRPLQLTRPSVAALPRGLAAERQSLDRRALRLAPDSAISRLSALASPFGRVLAGGRTISRTDRSAAANLQIFPSGSLYGRASSPGNGKLQNRSAADKANRTLSLGLADLQWHLTEHKSGTHGGKLESLPPAERARLAAFRVKARIGRRTALPVLGFDCPSRRSQSA
jgi:hypothetical protein